jgi:lauroyl/myristoyl acyltransferase
MLNAIFGGEFMLPGLPTTVALAAVATIGYLVGRRNGLRDETTSKQAQRDLDRALGETKQLEQITDEVLQATRRALDECRRFSAALRTDGATTLAPPAPSASPARREIPTLKHPLI